MFGKNYSTYIYCVVVNFQGHVVLSFANYFLQITLKFYVRTTNIVYPSTWENKAVIIRFM